MDSILEAIAEVLKFILWYVLWCIVLFNLGRASLLLVSLGKYPHGIKLKRDANFISGIGISVLFTSWLSLVMYNNWGNIIGATT